MPVDEMTGRREAAELLSRGCPECGGYGLTSRYAWVKTRDGRDVYGSVGFLCHCCPPGGMSDFLRACVAAGNYPRVLDLLNHHELQPDRFKFADESWLNEIREEGRIAREKLAAAARERRGTATPQEALR
jgi:hypothetical protein